MTDETRDAIRRRAKQFWIANDGEEHDPDGIFEDAYIEGADRQHPISFELGRKDGYRQAIDDALKELAHYKSLFEYPEDYVEIEKQLESLRDERA